MKHYPINEYHAYDTIVLANGAFPTHPSALAHIDRWINQPEKTLFKNIYHVVENGSPNNPAMQAFGKNGVLTGKDIQNVAAFVYHINQEQAPITEKEGGAAPQGTEAHWANE